MSTSTTINSQFLNYFGKIWKQFCNQGNNGNWENDPENDPWRESFELLGAALIYSYNGFIKYPESRLHSQVRPVRKINILWEPLLKKNRIPSFALKEGRELFATMNLASSSFRICTAHFLISKNSKSVPNPLSEFLKDNKRDWERDKLVENLKKAVSLGCCRESEDGLTDKIALAIIVAHRDEFGHGEIGGGDKKWVKKRKEYFEKLHPCRIFQAQLKLMKLGLTELAQMTK